MTLRGLARRVAYSEAALSTTLGYRFALKRRYGAGAPRGVPDAPWRNAVLKRRRDWEMATAHARALGLPPYTNTSKNWDGLAMLATTLQATRPSASVLDAGATLGSMILPWLFLYGYRNLIGINLNFDRPVRRGPIRYEPGDVTKTRFAAGTFDVVVCQSVLEHGVDVPAYLGEMARVLKSGGLLMTSVDYYAEPVVSIDAIDGLPYRVFSRGDIDQFLVTASALGLTPTDPVDLTCEERAVRWDAFGLEYTYLMLTLKKAELEAD